MHDRAAILRAILEGYTLPVRGAHGVVHWARVQENGLRIAEATDADTEVVALFALFHDSRRVNEYHDDGHGQRGGDFARTLRGSLVHLDDTRFELLYEACYLHTDGFTEGDPTVQACWDADPLDLGRVGIPAGAIVHGCGPEARPLGRRTGHGPIRAGGCAGVVGDDGRVARAEGSGRTRLSVYST